MAEKLHWINRTLMKYFFVTMPYSCTWSTANFGTTTTTAKGYLYFTIESGLEWAASNNELIYNRFEIWEGSNLVEQSPAELEQGKWYRQIIEVTKYKSSQMHSTLFAVRNRSKIEPIPEEFLN